MIEDSLAGIERQAARLSCAAVAHTYPRARALSAGADWWSIRLDSWAKS